MTGVAHRVAVHHGYLPNGAGMATGAFESAIAGLLLHIELRASAGEARTLVAYLAEAVGGRTVVVASVQTDRSLSGAHLMLEGGNATLTLGTTVLALPAASARAIAATFGLQLLAR